MAQKHIEENYTFVGGLNTEGGFLLTPKNTWKAGDNVIPQIDGSLARRKGVDFEAEHQVHSTNVVMPAEVDNWAYRTLPWRNVNGSGNLNFFVVQTGPILHFFDGGASSLSPAKLGFTIDLRDSKYSYSGRRTVVGTNPISVSEVYGKLLIVGEDIQPFVLEYVNNTLTSTTVSLEIRDFIGFDLGFPLTTEKTLDDWANLGLLPKQRYNLYNQGWDDRFEFEYRRKALPVNPNGAPSPAMTKSWIYGKNSDDVFDPTLLNRQDFGTSPAPKGRVVYDPFLDNRGEKAKILESTDDNILNFVTANPVPTRPTTCSFFAGRAWYAGIQDAAKSGWVLFSQVLDSTERIGACHQLNDPTAEVISDLLDSDGGLITIQGSGTIFAIRPIGNSMLVFANNGVWQISGADSGFTASNYTVNKITATGAINELSVVSVEGTIMWWAGDGIYAAAVNNLGDVELKNVTDGPLRSYFKAISPAAALLAEGTYDDVNKVVKWVYGFDSNNELNLDMRLGAWYTNTFSTQNPIKSTCTTIVTNNALVDFDVALGSDTVIAGVDDVVTKFPTREDGSKVFKYLTLLPGPGFMNFTFSDLNNKSFLDWGMDDAPAYVLTGYAMGNNGPARAKTGGYLTVLMKRTETSFDEESLPSIESGALLETRWDFTDDGVAGKWSAPVQVYRQLRPYFQNGAGLFTDGYPLVITKNKLRGRGKAVQMKYSSEPNKDMQLVGWTFTMIGNTDV